MKKIETVMNQCPHCGWAAEVPAAYRGREVACLRCEKITKVPMNARPQRPEKKKMGPVKTTLLVVGTLAALWILGSVLLGIFAGYSERAREGRESVRYFVDSSAQEVAVTMTNESGSIEQFTLTAAELPWDIVFEGTEGDFVTISAQMQDSPGVVVVEIGVNGEVVRKAESDAAYGIASAELRIGQN
jgi:hypothetical protein